MATAYSYQYVNSRPTNLNVKLNKSCKAFLTALKF